MTENAVIDAPETETPRKTWVRHLEKPGVAQALADQRKLAPKTDGKASRILSRLERKLASEDDPQKLNALTSAYVRLQGKPVATDDEGRDELVSRYRRAGYELPYAT